MANINITWTNPLDVSDIDTYEVYVCDLNDHKTTDAQFQTALDQIFAGTSTVPAENLVLVEDNIAKTRNSISSWSGSAGVGNHHFAIAAKNSGGYKVGDGTSAASAVFSLVVS